MIYFVQSKETGHIKIGFSDNFALRYSQLVNRFGALDVLATMSGEMALEVALHMAFASYNIQDLGREWFEDNPMLRNYILRFARTSEMAEYKVIDGLLYEKEMAREIANEVLKDNPTLLTASEFAKMLGVPYGRVHNALNGLGRYRIEGRVERKRHGRWRIAPDAKLVKQTHNKDYVRTSSNQHYW